MIKFHEPYNPHESIDFIHNSLMSGFLSGDRTFTFKCETLIKELIGCSNLLMTTSCTHALELAVKLLDIKAGDEVIIPSYTYPSTANAVVLTGAKIVYSPIDAKTMMLDVSKLESRISSKTKAIIVVHYGGACCDMDPIIDIANKHSLYIIEDAAQAFGSTYKGSFAGTIGSLGCFSFHNTKNLTAGEGGAIIINDDSLINRGKVFHQKGTNSWDFKSGLTSRYEWVDIGSSYSPSDLLMALLYGQLLSFSDIQKKRLNLFKRYFDFFTSNDFNLLEGFSKPSPYGDINGHIFYLLFKNSESAWEYREYMLKKGITVLPHFVPLHISKMGSQFLTDAHLFKNEDSLSDRLIRLPIYPSLSIKDQDLVLKETRNFMR